LATTAVNNVYLDSTEAFRSALADAGLLPGEVVADGVIRRCGTISKPQSRNGWYFLHADPPAGAYGNWATDLSETWSRKNETLSEDDRRRLRKDIERQKAERAAKMKADQAAAAEQARKYLAGLQPATAKNPYLTRKGVKTCPGILADGDQLVIPVLGTDSQPMSYQRIDPIGGKRFAPGAPVAGGWFAIKGDSGPLLVCEGIATGMSLHQANGHTVLVAFSAGNLEKVARMARERYPERQIILCADDDTKEELEE
jgi:putative DNA primase/helicase